MTGIGAAVVFSIFIFSLLLRFIIMRWEIIKSFFVSFKKKKASATPYKCFVISDMQISDYNQPYREKKKPVKY